MAEETFTVKNVNCDFLLPGAGGLENSILGDRRLYKFSQAVAQGQRGFTYKKDHALTNPVPGIVVAAYTTSQPRMTSPIDFARYKASERPDFEVFNSAYKVWTPCVKADLLPEDFDNKKVFEKKVASMQDVVVSLGANAVRGTIPPGTYVEVEFADIEHLTNPRIVRVGEKIFDISPVAKAPPSKEFKLSSYSPPKPLSDYKKTPPKGKADGKGNEVFKRNVDKNPVVVFFYPGLGYGKQPFVKDRVGEISSRDNIIVIVARSRATAIEDLVASAEKALEGNTASEYRLGGWSGGGFGLSKAQASGISFAKIIYADPEVSASGRSNSLLDIGSGKHKGAKMIYRPSNWTGFNKGTGIGVRQQELAKHLPSELYSKDEYYEKAKGHPQRYHTAIMLKALTELMS